MKKNIIPFILCIIPLIYVFSIYNSLPETIPIHFNGKGDADDFGNKNFIFLGGFMPLFVWIVMLFAKKFDTKNRLSEMGSKFDNFLIGNILIMSLIGIIMVWSMSHGGVKFEMRWLLIVIGGLFILMGNYMPSFKPNYFIGIRNAWTLENEEVWKKTHKLGGYCSLVGGLLLICIALIMNENMSITYPILISTFIVSIIPTIYSYWYFQKINNQ